DAAVRHRHTHGLFIAEHALVILNCLGTSWNDQIGGEAAVLCGNGVNLAHAVLLMSEAPVYHKGVRARWLRRAPANLCCRAPLKVHVTCMIATPGHNATVETLRPR